MIPRILTLVIYGYQFVWRQSANLVKYDLCNTYTIALSSYTMYYISPYSFGYALIQIPIGLLLDRICIIRLMKYIFLLFMFSILLYIMHLYYHSIYIACISRFIAGISGGTLYNFGVKITTLDYHGDKKCLSHQIGMFTRYGIGGGIVCEYILYELNKHTGYITTMLTIGIIGILIMCTVFFINDKQYSTIQTKSDTHIMHDLSMIIGNYRFMILIICASILYAIGFIFSNIIGIMLIENVYHITSNSLITKCTSANLIGMIVGLQILPRIVQIIGRKSTFLLCSTIQITSLILLISQITHNYVYLIILFFFTGIPVGQTPIVLPIYVEKFENMRGLAVSTHNMLIWLCLTILPIIITSIDLSYGVYIVFAPMLILSLSVGLIMCTDIPHIKKC